MAHKEMTSDQRSAVLASTRKDIDDVKQLLKQLSRQGQDDEHTNAALSSHTR
jgi:hypothetical protein